MSAALKHYVQAVWVGIAIQIAGRILDGRWHATHDEFEGASQQLEAHWLLWLGVAVTLVAAGLALARLSRAERNLGFSVLFASGVFYTGVAIWHFIEHANDNDPEVAHVLLAIGQLGIIAGAIVATAQARRTAASVPT
jgi:hypothetical protein